MLVPGTGVPRTSSAERKALPVLDDIAPEPAQGG